MRRHQKASTEVQTRQSIFIRLPGAGATPTYVHKTP